MAKPSKRRQAARSFQEQPELDTTTVQLMRLLGTSCVMLRTVPRRSIPLCLVALLALLSVGAAAAGLSQPRVKNQANSLDSVVRHTMRAPGFTMHVAGQVLVYQAPDRTSVHVGSTAEGTSVVSITIGSTSYLGLSGRGPWLKSPSFAEPKVNGRKVPGWTARDNALEYLQVLLEFKNVQQVGNTYFVPTIREGFPLELDQFVPSYTINSKNSSTMYMPYPALARAGRAPPYAISARVRVEHGYVVSESFSIVGPIGGPHGVAVRRLTGTVGYSKFGSSGPVTAPTSGRFITASPSQPVQASQLR